MPKAHHFFVSPGELRADRVELTGSEAHHAARVLRIKVGERITVADGTGVVVEAVVRTVGDAIEADVSASTTHTARRPAVTIVQAISPAASMDDLVDRAVEVGAMRIVPFRAERSIVRWDAAKQRKAVDRWRAIALAAAKRCVTAWLPTVDDVASDPHGVRGDQRIVLEPSAPQRLRDVLWGEPADDLAFVVGPEGGLSPTEIDALVAGGATTASLGDLVLRTRSAGAIATAIAGYAYGWLG